MRVVQRMTLTDVNGHGTEICREVVLVRLAVETLRREGKRVHS